MKVTASYVCNKSKIIHAGERWQFATSTSARWAVIITAELRFTFTYITEGSHGGTGEVIVSHLLSWGFGSWSCCFSSNLCNLLELHANSCSISDSECHTDSIVNQKVFPWFKWLVACLSPRRPVFDPRPVFRRLTVCKVIHGLVFTPSKGKGKCKVYPGRGREGT